MSPLDFAISLLATLAVHATLALGAAWLLERLGALRHPGWAELAWRAALFGALLSTTLVGLRWLGTQDAPAPAAAATLPVAASPVPTGPTRPEATPPHAAMATPRPATAPTEVLPPARAATSNATPPTRIDDPAMRAAGAPPSSAATLALPDSLAYSLLGLWSLVLALAALRLGRQAWRLRRVARRLPELARPGPAPLARHARDLAAHAGLPAPVLAELPGLDSPMLMPGGTLLVPDWAATLPASQQRALLAHELAHLQRRDPAWRLWQRAALLPLAWHPLARHAVRRLEALAEDACDARAAEWLGDGRALAECLATCLAHAGPRAGAPALAVAMAGEPGLVVRRVRNLLENPAMSARPISPVLRRTALVLGLAAIVALPGLAIGTFAGNAFASMGDVVFSDGDEHRYRANTDEGFVDLRIRGDVRFNVAETDVDSLGEGARFSLVVERDDVEHSYRVDSEGGQLVRRYRVDGKDAPIDAAARAWLAKELPVLLAETGINAEARGKRILAEGGVPALLGAIDALRGEHAARIYSQVLVANAALDDAQLDRLLDRVDGFDSDYERRLAYAAVIEHQALATAGQVRLLSALPGMPSDYEKRLVLQALVARHFPAGEAAAAWRAAVDSLGSDYERRQAIEGVLEHAPANLDAIALAIDASAKFGSDYEARQVLEAVAPTVATQPRLHAAFGRAMARIGSDYEQRQVLMALVHEDVDVATARLVLDHVDGIGSGYEAGQVLQALAAVMPADPALIERYRASARRLSDHERGQAERALDRFAVARVD